MREPGQRSTRRRQQQQRRRRYAAAALSLATLAVGVFGVSIAARGSDVSGSASSSRPGAVPAPRPLASSPVAYLSTIAALGQNPRLQPAAQGPQDIGGSPAGPSAVPSPQPRSADQGPVFAPAPPARSAASPMALSDPLTGTAFPGLPQVGALFGYSGGATDSHFCSGSVVASSTGDIVVTAAHCVYDSSSGSFVSDIAFVPGYHDGQQPYGVWTPARIVVAPQWLNDQDPDYDVAFLVVHQPGSTQRIQDAVGADQLGVDSDFAALTQVVGYPIGTEQPITCTDYTKQFSPTQLEFDCPGYPEGTSGGPFLTDVDPQTGQGTVVGVIGGYETGGDTPDVSYSAYFNDSIAALFNQAEAAG